jgi:hypothetical protein
MLSTDKAASYWCLEEDDQSYWHEVSFKHKKLSTPFDSARYFDLGTNVLLGPVCLGFWRG